MEEAKTFRLEKTPIKRIIMIGTSILDGMEDQILEACQIFGDVNIYNYCFTRSATTTSIGSFNNINFDKQHYIGLNLEEALNTLRSLQQQQNPNNGKTVNNFFIGGSHTFNFWLETICLLRLIFSTESWLMSTQHYDGCKIVMHPIVHIILLYYCVFFLSYFYLNNFNTVFTVTKSHE